MVGQLLFVEVMIITGMYAGVSGKIVESHKTFVRVLTAFDSVERYPPENSHDSLSNYIKPMLPKKGDKGIVILPQEESNHALAANHGKTHQFKKGDVVFIVDISKDVATCKNRQSDLPSSYFKIQVESLAKLAYGSSSVYTSSQSSNMVAKQANQISPNKADNGADSSVDVSEFEYEVYVGVILKSVTNGLLICLYKRENCCTIMVDSIAIDDAILNGKSDCNDVNCIYLREEESIFIVYNNNLGKKVLVKYVFDHEMQAFSKLKILKIELPAPINFEHNGTDESDFTIVSLALDLHTDKYDTNLLLAMSSCGELYIIETKKLSIVSKLVIPKKQKRELCYISTFLYLTVTTVVIRWQS